MCLMSGVMFSSLSILNREPGSRVYMHLAVSSNNWQTNGTLACILQTLGKGCN